MAKVQQKPLKIMVASTIHGFTDQLDQICATLKGYGYHVLNSHIKTIKTNSGKSNLALCKEAVDACDLFLGIITPRYGAEIEDGISITHHEMRHAIALNKPRWFTAHRDISIARQLLKQYMYLPDKTVNPDFSYKRTAVMDDIRIIDMYNDTIQNDVYPEKRVGHWTEDYFKVGDILTFLETQFEDIEQVRELVEQLNAAK